MNEDTMTNLIDDITLDEVTNYAFEELTMCNNNQEEKPVLISIKENTNTTNNILQEINTCSTDTNVKNNYDCHHRDVKSVSLEKNIDESFELSMEIIKDNLVHDKQLMKQYKSEIKNTEINNVTKPPKINQDENVNNTGNDSKFNNIITNKKRSVKNLSNVKFIIINNKIKLPTNNKYFNLNNDNNKSFKLKFNNNNDMYVLKIVKPINLSNQGVTKENKTIEKRIEKVNIPPISDVVVNNDQAGCEKKERETQAIVENVEVNNNVGRKDIEPPEKKETLLKPFNLSEDRLVYFRCNMCQTNFKTKDEYKNHLPGCKSEVKVMKCNMCDNNFKFAQSLNRHVRTVHYGDKSHVCEICDKRFSRRNELLSHLMIHSGVKNEVCHICGLSFTLKRNLRAHLFVHNVNESGDRRFKCDICEKRFKQRKNLIEHFAVHNDMNNNGNVCKRYKCPLCKKLYKKSTYVRHYNRRHCGDIAKSTFDNYDLLLQNE